MSNTFKILILAAGVLGLVQLAACSRDITVAEVPDAAAPQSCLKCHSDQDTWLVAIERQWTNSRHGEGLVAFEGTSAGCARCHSSEGFLDYIAGNDVTGYPNPTMIHCFTCHAPHTDSNFGLRVTEPVALLDGTSYDIGNGNTCVNCHQSRRLVSEYVYDGVSLSRRFGPHHGPQSDLLFATNHYEFEGYAYKETAYHRTQTDDGCVTCHMSATGYYTVGGHSWNMEGDVEGEITLNVGACEACHGEVPDFNIRGVQDSVVNLGEQLRTLLEVAGLVDAAGTPRSVKTSADSAGAVYNYVSVIKEDRSKGVHNPKYAIGLLQSSIEFMQGAPAADELARGMRIEK